jgi:hypothetical protein
VSINGGSGIRNAAVTASQPLLDGNGLPVGWAGTTYNSSGWTPPCWCGGSARTEPSHRLLWAGRPLADARRVATYRRPRSRRSPPGHPCCHRRSRGGAGPDPPRSACAPQHHDPQSGPPSAVAGGPSHPPLSSRVTSSRGGSPAIAPEGRTGAGATGCRCPAAGRDPGHRQHAREPPAETCRPAADP